MSSTTTTPFWKKIHQTVSGYTLAVTDDIVAEILRLSKDELMLGLLSYKPYTKESYDTWLKDSSVSSAMNEFIHELSQHLDLETNIAYTVMCNYLMFEYYGKIKEFWQITRYGTTVRLKESIWNFYTSERMFLLKTLRHIFEFHDDTANAFSKQYKEFLDAIKVEELQNNLIKQFDCLMNEMNPRNVDVDDKNFDHWLCRNLREQTEVLLVILLSASHSNFSNTQFAQILKLFVQHNFTTQPCFFDTVKIGDPKDLQELMSAEIGCYFILLNAYWEKDLSDFWKETALADLDLSLLHIHVQPENSIVLLAWFMLKAKSIDFDDVKIMELLDKKPFVTLHTVLSSQIFENCKAGPILLRATHKMMDQLCLLFSDRKVLFEQAEIASVTADILKLEDLAEISLKNRDGLDNIVTFSIETFPYDFFSLTEIAHVLLGLRSLYKSTIHLLNKLPTLLSDMTWTVPREEVFVLKTDQAIFPDSNLIICPARTQVRSYAIFDKNLLQYQGSFSYFLYLEYLMSVMIDDGPKRHRFDPVHVRKIVAGYGVVIQAIKSCRDMDMHVIDVQRTLDKINKLLTFLDGPLLNFDLVKVYFEVQMALVIYRQGDFFNQCPDLVWKIFFPRIKMEYAEADIASLLFNRYIFEDTIFLKLFQDEEFKDDHEFLLTYVEILFNLIKAKSEVKHIQLSGVAHLLNFVFLQHQSWRYKDECQKTRITLKCLNLFHFVLQKRPEDLSESEKSIFYLCQHAFLNNVYIIEAFLKLFVKDKYHLIFVMERESNWSQGSSLVTLHCIRMQLALLLIIMNHKNSMATRCVIDDKLSFVVKPIASYFTNAYSPIIAELSCRFLEKMAQNPDVTLLALLELDHYQVQCLFLERLRDPLEEENVKIAIIDLINVCVANQDGMTAAFFNLKCFMYWDGIDDGQFSGDTVSDFMVDYLQNIKKSHEYFKSPLQLGILKLLYNLWSNHKENLIENITNLKEFWPVMMDPFFCAFKQDIEIYIVILRIINLEIGTNVDKVEPKLLQTITAFLNNKSHLQACIDFVLNETSENSNLHVELLSAWMEFLILTKKVTPDSFTDDAKDAVILSCLEGLVDPITRRKDLEIVYLWSQLYLMLITSWPIYEKHEYLIVKKISQFLHSLPANYKLFPAKIKENVYSLINRTLVDLKNYFDGNRVVLNNFIAPVGILIDLEYEYVDNEIWRIEDDEIRVNELKSWLIITFIGNALLAVKDVEDLELWFSYRRFLDRTMETILLMLKRQASIPFAKLAIDFLITYAESTLAKDFLLVDLCNFYYMIQTPSLTISVTEAILSGFPIQLKEWWLIFSMLIRLNRTLIKNLKGGCVDTCLAFISQHDSVLREITCLTMYTVDMTALTLVSEILQFFHAMLFWQPRWASESSHSYQVLMDAIKNTINACILSVLGSKKINFYTIDGNSLDVINTPDPELLVSVVNKLLEILYWACSCLKKTRPDLLRLLKAPISKESATLLVEIDFSVPRFELPITSKLTYGKLLCLSHYLCKTLNQLSPETPLVTPRRQSVSMTDLTNQLKVESLTKIFEHCTASYEKYIGFMVYLQRTDDVMNEKLSSFLHYETTEFSGSSVAISELNYHVVLNALEALMSFLAAETFFAHKKLEPDVLFSYKRELCSELQFFYEFVRKRTSELYNSITVSPRPLFLQNEPDIIQRYMVTKMSGNINDVADRNFMLVISQWFIKICELSN